MVDSGLINTNMSTATNNLSEALFRRQLGMLFFIATEAMMFAGLISAYLVLSKTAASWPPPEQPRLPIVLTGFNTLLLLWSGVCVALAAKNPASLRWLTTALLGGFAFLAIQGGEWLRLIHYGLSVENNTFAGTFYVIIGTHAIHVFLGAIALAVTLIRGARQGILNDRFQISFTSSRLYWYFVVGVWPILYALVYL